MSKVVDMSFFDDEDRSAFQKVQRQIAQAEAVSRQASDAQIVPLYHVLVARIREVFCYYGEVKDAYCRVDYPPESNLSAPYLQVQLAEYFARSFGVPNSQFELKVHSMLLEGSGYDMGVAICIDIRFDPPLT